MTTIKTVIALVRGERQDLPSPTCPLCHTVDDTITSDALAAGATWRCTRCGQMWSADRLATAEAYAQTQAGAAVRLM
jgi:transposase-like protein